MVHFVEETDHVYPEWQVVSPDETASTSLVRERSGHIPHSPFQIVTWLCNHCSDYLAPPPPMQFGSRVMLGSKRETIQHVKAEYVRSLAALPESTLNSSQTRHRRPHGGRGLILVSDFWRWYRDFWNVSRTYYTLIGLGHFKY